MIDAKTKKALTDEKKEIERQYGKATVKEWDSIDVDDMDSNEAFDRGYYRGLQYALGK